MTSPDFDATEFADLAARLHAAGSPSRTASEVISYARAQLDAEYAGITVIRGGGRLQTMAETDPLVSQVDAWQYELGEGPSRDASFHEHTLICQDLATDERWPAWGPKAYESGIASVLSAELVGPNDRRLGSVNMYWVRARIFTADDVAYASIFARHAALVLASSLEVAGLNVAMDGRKRIGQAQGMLMERHELGENAAFEVLKRYSQDHNLKLREVAERLVATRTLPGP